MRGAVPAPDWVWERYTPGHAGGGFTDSGPQAQRIQSRERSSAKRCESERLPRIVFPPPHHASAPSAHSLQRGAAALRMDRSLRPEFWRIPAPVRGSEPLACKHRLGNAFRAASGAARSAAGASGCPQRVSAGASAAGRGPPPAGASGCHASCFRLLTTQARPAPAACNTARRSIAWTAHSGRNSGEFRPPFAALNHWRANTALATHSEPRAEQREALRERAVATHRVSASTPRQLDPRPRPAQRGAPVHRVDRSLRPEFWRIPAPVRGSEPLACKHCPGNGFRAASGAARSAAGASGCHSTMPFRPL